MANENVQFFLRAVNERFMRFQESLAALFSAISAEKIEKKRAAASETLSALNDLLAIISDKDRPSWANTLKEALSNYIRDYNNTGSSYQLLKVLIANNSEIKHHKWSFHAAETGVDFEALYEAHYKGSKAPGLFEKLLELLQNIVDSGEVDSVRAIAALEKLIATIRANMRGTYFQTVGVSHFAFALMKNYLWKILKNVPAIGSLLDAVAETMNELDIEMSEVHSEVRKQLGQFAKGEIDAIAYQQHDLKALPSAGEDTGPKANCAGEK